jgi:hypothetical protein
MLPIRFVSPAMSASVLAERGRVRLTGHEVDDLPCIRSALFLLFAVLVLVFVLGTDHA